MRAQPCEFPRSPAHALDTGHAGGEPHHEPTTGANGLPYDDLVAAACRVAHDLCEVAPRNGGWTREAKQAAAHRTRTAFRRLAPAALQVQVAEEELRSLARSGKICLTESSPMK